MARNQWPDSNKVSVISRNGSASGPKSLHLYKTPLIDSKLKMVLEYSQETLSSTIKILYQGKKIDFVSKMDELQKKFMDVAVASISEEIDAENNIIKIEVK